MKTCRLCGKPILRSPEEKDGNYKRRKYCTKKCAMDYNNGKRVIQKKLKRTKIIEKIKQIYPSGLRHRVAKIVWWDFNEKLKLDEIISEFMDGFGRDILCDVWPAPKEVEKHLINLGYTKKTAHKRLLTYRQSYESAMDPAHGA